MGTFRTTAEIARIVHREHPVAVEMLVDAGSEPTWVPSSVLEGLAVAPEKDDMAFVVANGRQVTRSVGFAIAHVKQMFTIDEVVFAEPGDMAPLGARALGGLNLAVDPARKRLDTAGPLPAAFTIQAR